MAITNSEVKGPDRSDIHGHEEQHGHGHPTSFLSKYIFSFDHKVIGIQYLLLAMVMSLVGVGLSVVFRSGGRAGGMPETHVSYVTMHGTIMIFVVSLALRAASATTRSRFRWARDAEFAAEHAVLLIVLVGAVIMTASFFVGRRRAGGWTAYPLSALSGFGNVTKGSPGSGMGQTLWLLAMALFIVSFTMGGLNYVATVLNLRARGMSLMRMPLTVWTWFVAALLGLLSFPALTAAAIMLLLDRHAGTSFFLPTGLVVSGQQAANIGGTPLLFQHLFWFLGHPEVYVLVLPALGIPFDVIACFTTRPDSRRHKTNVYSLCLAPSSGWSCGTTISIHQRHEPLASTSPSPPAHHRPVRRLGVKLSPLAPHHFATPMLAPAHLRRRHRGRRTLPRHHYRRPPLYMTPTSSSATSTS